jgi:type IV pilus assembly protein PilC
MLFAKQFSSATLSQVCRMLRTGLDAGLPIVRVFRQQADRGPVPARPMLTRVADRLANGDSLAEALEPEKGLLPPLFVSMLAVGEETGHMGEILRELEEYFDQMRQLRRMFLIQIFWPALQLQMAIGVIALFIFVQGWFGLQDMLGFGTGVRGALNWLALVFIVAIIVYLIYTGMTRQIRFLAPVERITLAMPMLGGALRAVLLSRFCMGAKLALGAGISTKRAMQLSFEAAGSALYNQSFEHAKKGIKRGESVHEVLSRCSIFPEDFLNLVAVGEEAGSLPESLGKQAENYREDAAMRLKVLAQSGAWFVYFLVAVFLITMIFRIATGAMAPVNEMLKGL